jgi:uncharacterized protein YaaN involved in tellurite resistance
MTNNLEFTQSDKIKIFVDEIFSFSPDNEEHKQIAEKMALDVGKEIQLKSMTMSDIIKKPLNQARSLQDDNVSKNLQLLHKQIETLNPNNALITDSFVAKIATYLPFLASPLDKYKGELLTGEKVINEIIKSLKEGQKYLENDNNTLKSDQRTLWRMGEEIKKSLEFAQEIAKYAQEKLSLTLSSEGESKQRFMKDRFLFPLSQRILDLQQQSAVFQQATMSIELIVNNNKELIRGVERTLGVSVSALQVATMTAFALSHQKDVLDNIDSINTLTSDLLVQNSVTLKQQGSDIQQRASSTLLDMDKLKTSFSNLSDALKETSAFREKTLNSMIQSTKEYEAFLLATKPLETPLIESLKL